MYCCGGIEDGIFTKTALGEPEGYIAHMSITSNNLDVYVKAFPTSLIGRARDWYMALPLKTIDTYQQTEDAFVAIFGTAVQKGRMNRSLWIFNRAKMNL
ncbi:hypothetical protein LIER_42134 [Lithospermum erythrorhizon]|uniref:Retrotransposon gag domain-containing protein n=1 Tax=Lithospermum erythrorhizon TaxID=34254 RepID=A0AAV3RP19_LITER